jgi:ankyrin repeat protein
MKRPMLRRVFAMALVVLTVGAGMFGYGTYRQRQLDRALTAAVKDYDAETVAELLRQHANANALEGSALPRDSPIRALRRLLHLPDSRTSERDVLTTLYLYAVDGHTGKRRKEPVALTKELLSAGADVRFRRQDGMSALDLVALHGFSNCVALLLAAGADPNGHNGRGTTVLMHAVFGNDISTVRTLIRAGADVNAHSVGGGSVLDFAPAGIDPRIIKMLKEAGAVR